MVAANGKEGVRLFVYALCEPDGKTIRYIGLSGNLWKRLLNHYRNATMPRVREWVNSLRARGHVPSLVVLREVVGVSAGLRAEADAIREHVANGCDLLNEQQTGRGVPRKRIGRVEFNGRRQTLSQWAKELGITRQALNLRLHRHPIDVALSRGRSQNTPIGETVPPPTFVQGSEVIEVDPTEIGPIGLSHRERRDRRRKMAEAVSRGAKVIDVALAFGVTTATVHIAIRENQLVAAT